MTEEAFAVQLARIDERSRRNEGRIKALEAATEALHKIAASIEVIANEQRNIKKDVRALHERTAAAESRPGRLWDRLMAALLGAAVSGLVAFWLTRMGMG